MESFETIKKPLNINVLILLLTVLLAACGEKAAPPLTATKTLSEIGLSTANNQTSSLIFKDITTAAGISFTYDNGAIGDKWFPESMIGGVGFFDYNNDGYADLIAVRGKDWQPSKNVKSSVVVYKNNGDSTFTDVTRQLDMQFFGYGMGLALADFNGDGWVDVFVSAYGANKLYRNEAGKRFVDVTDAYGVAGNQFDFSVAASFVDVDNDGDLDLFVGNYLDWTPAIDTRINTTFNGHSKMYPHPNSFAGTASLLYRNEGGLAFTDVSVSSGIVGDTKANNATLTKALGVYPVDINGDHFIDLVVANDSIKNFAFINDGKGGFSEQADEFGLSYNNLGLPTAAMGIDGAWLAEEQTLHIAMGNFSGEMTSFYRYDPIGFFGDVAPLTGIGSKTRLSFTFGVLFADLDLDGYEDFIQANGDVNPDIELIQPSSSYEQKPQVFLQCHGDCQRPFMLIDTETLGDLNLAMVGRGLASADIDHDGDLDLVISSVNGPLRLFRNDQTTTNNWLRIKLDDEGGNRQAIGALLEIRYGNHHQKQQLMPTGSYVSQNEAVVTFGLGAFDKVDSLTITWPEGQVQTVNNIAAQQLLTVKRASQ